MSDLISRQDVLDAIYGITPYKGTIPLESAIFNIQKVPSAEHHKLNIAEYIHDRYPDVWKQAEKELEVPSAERTGKWIQISPAGIYECSECGQNLMTDDIDCYHYCHHCGAKMEGERRTE